MKVKVHGAGSSGNHLTNASRSLGWSVDMCDIDASALARTKNEIYPSRYGSWDDSIGLFESKDAPKGGYDLVVISTPPDHHVSLALEAVKEDAKAVWVEKPFCTPDLAGVRELISAAKAKNVSIFTGYDHVAGRAAERFAASLESKSIGDLQTLDVEFREFWGGIFKAHPWLDGPHDSYLGFYKRGGGASGEHSHAANLWQYFAHSAGAGRVVEVSAHLEYVKNEKVDYDSLCLMHLTTENGLLGRVVQDVVTEPTRKWGRAQGTSGAIEWHCNFEPGFDAVAAMTKDGERTLTKFAKTRPDDFILGLKRMSADLDADPSKSSLSMERGLETMLVVAACHLSFAEKRSVKIDYAKGFGPEALSVG